MSFNRFESTSPFLCAKPDTLTPAMVKQLQPARLIIDLLENWTDQQACAEVEKLLIGRTADQSLPNVLLRIGMPVGGIGQQAIGRLVALRPDGVVLAGCGKASEIQKLDVMLRVAEAEGGLTNGTLTILAEVGGQPGFFLSFQPLTDLSERLEGIIFNSQALAQSTQSEIFNASADRSGAPVFLARAHAVMMARQANLPCHDLLEDHRLSADGLRSRQDISFADGFSGIIVRNTAQLTALVEPLT